MQKIPVTIFLVVLTFLTTLGLAISLQEVLGINIGSVLNLGGNKITNLGTPTAAGDAATRGYVDTVLNTTAFQARITGSCVPGQIIRVVNGDGTVACQ